MSMFWLQGDRAYRDGASEDSCPYCEDYGKQKGESLNAREEWLCGYRGQKDAY